MNFITPFFTENYTPPDYAKDTSSNNMTVKNTNYDNFILNKNSVFNNFYTYISNSVYNSTNFGGFSSITTVNNIKNAIDNYKNTTDYVSNYDYSTKYNKLLDTNEKVNKKRMDMDIAISRLNSPKNLNSSDDSQILYNSHFFINILWIILAVFTTIFIFYYL